MANLILGYPNRIDDCTLSGGSWQATLPLTNLQDRRLAKVARTTDATAASTTFSMDLTRDRAIKMIALVKHNISIAQASVATFRVRGSAVSNFSTTVYDSGTLDVYPAIFDSLVLEWEDDNYFDGRPTEEYIDDLRETSTLNLIHVLPAATSARYWRVDIVDEDNADGYVEIGRVFISTQWQVTNNMLYGVSLGYETTTEVDQSINGTEYFDVRKNYRNMRFELESDGYDEGHQKLLDISRKLGVNEEVFIVPDPDDEINMSYRAFLGRLKSLNPILYPYFNTNKAAFEVKEIT